jgi:hypothetical protein
VQGPLTPGWGSTAHKVVKTGHQTVTKCTGRHAPPPGPQAAQFPQYPTAPPVTWIITGDRHVDKKRFLAPRGSSTAFASLGKSRAGCHQNQ